LLGEKYEDRHARIVLRDAWPSTQRECWTVLYAITLSFNYSRNYSGK
jgi:hypothetical protein